MGHVVWTKRLIHHFSSHYFASKLGIRSLLVRQLRKVATNISFQDRMIKRELLIGYMTQRELDWACFRRGMNPYVNKNRMEMESFLREWLRWACKYFFKFLKYIF